MANNYAVFSEFMVMPEDKKPAYEAFITEYMELCDTDQIDWFGGIELEWDELYGHTGVWIHAEENYTDEELYYLVRGLLKVAESDGPFIVNVAYYCSKPRIGESSGGCYAIWQDGDYYADPLVAVMDYIKFHDGKPE